MLKKQLQIILLVFLVHTGVYGQSYALDFDGSNDYVTTPIDVDLQAMPSTTWSGWIKPTGVSGWQIIFGMEDAGWDRFLIIENGGLGLSMGHTNNRWATGASVTAGVWQHVVVVYDNGAMRFYFNGTAYATSTTEGNHSSAGTFTIGGNQSHAPANYYRGLIDEVAVWNEALTAAEITTLYNSGSGLDAASSSGNYTSSSNLVGYYKMNEGTGTTTTDASGNGNTATLSNMDESTDWVTGYAIQDNTAPTGSLTYSISGTTASSVSENDVVTITATFNENIADSPVVQISGSGVETISATNMTKVSANSYTYAWTVGTGAGAQTFALATGTDIAGNIVTAIPTSGVTIVIDAPQHLTKYGKISIGSADLINKYGATGGSSGLTANGKRISTSTAPDGLTSATASRSAYQIKQDFPGSTDGLYWIANSNINSGTPFQIYADMTTDGGGWMILNVGAGNSTAPERSTLTSPNTLGYLPRTTVIELAEECTEVQLRSGDSSVSYGHKTTSTSPLAIGALKNTSNDVNGAGTWANGASSTFVVNLGSWLWAYCCPGSAVGWPKMYHSSNYTHGVHWFADSGMGRKHSNTRDAWFSTWIR